MESSTPFIDRKDAGRKLASALSAYAGKPQTIVLALPRGGVPVAYEIAAGLDLPLDLMLVRKLGVPGDEELALGALAMNGVRVFNDEILQRLSIPQYVIDQVVAAQSKELIRRNEVYRHGRPMPDLKDRTVLLVDDGIATGANMRAAIFAARSQHASCIVVAVPVASKESIFALRQQADDVVCLLVPDIFFGVGNFYEDFSQTEDAEVIALLNAARSKEK